MSLDEMQGVYVIGCSYGLFFFFSSRRRHTIYWRDCSSDVCSSDLLSEAAGARAVDGRLGGGEDRALQGRGEHDLAHPVLALQGVGRVVFVRHALPDLLEDGARDHTGQDAAEQADRPVDEFGSLAAHLVLLAARRAFAAFFAVLFVVFLAALRAVLRAAFSAAARRAAGTLAARFAPRAATPRSFLRGRPTRRASRATTPAPAATKVGRRTALS